MPKYMTDPVDFYISHKQNPRVYKFEVEFTSMLNGVHVANSPILYEEGDNFSVNWYMQKIGKVEFNDYMKFLHEAYKCGSLNIES